MIIRKSYSYTGLNRKGEDGSFLCIPASINKRIFLNEQAVDIYNSCHGLSIREVLEIEKNKYPNVDLEKLEKNVESVVWFYHNLGMLELKGEDVVVKENSGESLMMLGEKDFNNVSDFIIKMHENKNNEYVYYITPEYKITSHDDIINVFSLPILRLSHVNGGNIYYKYSRENSFQIDGVVGFDFIGNNSTTYLKALICKKKDMKKIIDKLREELEKNEYKCMKVKILSNDIMADFLEKCGFVKEAILKCESPEDEDIEIYLLEK